MVAVLAPVLQEYVPPPVAVIVGEAPLQIILSLTALPEFSVTLIDVEGIRLTVIVVVVIAVQPPVLVTVTV